MGTKKAAVAFKSMLDGYNGFFFQLVLFNSLRLSCL